MSVNASSSSSESISPGIPPVPPELKRAEKDALSIANSDPDNWEWDDKSRAAWESAREEWQAFKIKWYNTEDNPGRILPLEPLSSVLTGFLQSILVREDYVTMFDYIWARVLTSGCQSSLSENQAPSEGQLPPSESSGQTGVIIKGQPGNGKTLFQLYLLVRLLQLKQVVLFSLDGENLYLFYHDGVHYANTATLRCLDPQSRIPQPKPSSPHVFIWTLIDVEMPHEPERFLVAPPCLPVQTASPNPVRYKIWAEQQGPMLTGLPLWTRGELEQGLPLQRRYLSLMDALRKYKESKKYREIDWFPGTRALLLGLEETNEDHGEEKGASPLPEVAISHLLDAAIDRFGYSARDVFAAVFNYKGTTLSHQESFNLTYKGLTDTVSLLATGCTTRFDISNKILTLYLMRILIFEVFSSS